MRRPCFPVGSVRKDARGSRFNGCVVCKRPAAMGFGCRLTLRSARTGDAFLAMAAHVSADDGRYDV